MSLNFFNDTSQKSNFGWYICFWLKNILYKTGSVIFNSDFVKKNHILNLGWDFVSYYDSCRKSILVWKEILSQKWDFVSKISFVSKIGFCSENFSFSQQMDFIMLYESYSMINLVSHCMKSAFQKFQISLIFLYKK